MKSRIKTLVITSLLQTNRNQGSDKAKKQITRKNVLFRTVSVQLLVFFLYSFVTIDVMSQVSFIDSPGMFSKIMGNFAIFALFINFTAIYQVFLDDQAIAGYLTLPYTKEEIFKAKFITAAISSSGLFLPLATIIAGAGITGGANIAYSVLSSLVAIVVIYLAMFFASLFILYYIVSSRFFQKHKGKIITIGLVLTFVLMFFMGFKLGGVSDQTDAAVSEVTSVFTYLFDCFRLIYLAEDRLVGWLGIAGWALVGLVLSLIVKRVIVPKLFNEKPQVSPSQTRQKERKAKPQSELASFIKYQFSLISDPSLIYQILMSKLFLPLIIGIVIHSTGVNILDSIELTPPMIGIYLIVGFVMAFYTLYMDNLSNVIISLEKENYHYIKTLPFSFEGYLRAKFKFAFAFEWLSGIVGFLVIFVALRIPFWVALFIVIGYTIAVWLISTYNYQRDWKMLSLNWSNTQELYDRGMNKTIRTIMIILAIYLVTFVSVIGVFVLYTLDSYYQWIVTGLVVILLACGLVITNWQAEKKFWPNVMSETQYWDVVETKQEISENFKKHRYFPARPLNWMDTILLVICSSIGLQLIASIVIRIMLVRGYVFGDIQSLLTNLSIILVIVSLVLTLVVIYLRKIPLINYKQVKKPDWKLIPGLTKNDWKFLAKYIPTAYILHVLGSNLIQYLTGSQTTANQSAIESSVGSLPVWVVVLSMVIAAPIVEEVLFRGLVMFRKPDRQPSWLSVIISSLLFALAHTPDNLLAWYTYFGSGLICSYAAKKTRSLEAGIIYHFVNNLIAVIVMYLA